MKKYKLFLNSTDVVHMTGYSLRTARAMLSHVRAELKLSNRQAITIYDFCKVFNIPVDVLFYYINHAEFITLPLTREDLTKLSISDLRALANHNKIFKMDIFDAFGKMPKETPKSGWDSDNS